MSKHVLRRRFLATQLLATMFLATLFLTTMFATGLLWPTPAAGAAGAEALDLDQAKALAQKNNHSLKAAQERLVQAELAIDKAWVMVKPQLNATGTYTHHGTVAALRLPDINSLQVLTDPDQCGGDPFCISFENYYDYSIQKQDSFGLMASLSQPLFVARAYTGIKSAYLSVDIAKLSTSNLEENLLHSVEVTYYAALTAQKLVEIARNSVEIRSEHLRVAQAKFDVGDTPKISLLRAEIEVNRAEQDLRRAENGHQLSKEALGLLIGATADFELVQPPAPTRPAQSLQDFIDGAMRHRRDVDVARLELELAEGLEQDAWFRFLPSLAFSGLFRLSDVKGFTDEYYSWSLGLILSIPLYDGGMRYAALDEARSRIRQAQLKLEERKDTISSEIRQLWLKMEMAEANLIKARRALELATEQMELARMSFEAGAVTNLEVLDANSVLFVSETAVIQEELALQLTILRLRAARRLYNPAGAISALAAPAQ